jgi:hypothetical protein
MALVICRVLTTLRMRRRMSRMFGMNRVVGRWSLVQPKQIVILSGVLCREGSMHLLRYCFARRHELLLRFFDYRLQLAFQRVV